MTFEEIMNVQRLDKKIVDSLKINYLDIVDLNVCNYVVSQLTNIDISKVNFGNEISFEEMIDISACELCLFDKYFKYDVVGLLSKTAIHRVADDFGFGAYISYNVGNDLLVPSRGMVTAYSIPDNLYEISSYFLSHEHIHAFKDTTHYEYIYNKTLGEVIPMFYEFISCGDNINLRKEMLKVRLSFLLDNKKEYMFFCSLINDVLKDKFVDFEKIELYHFIRSKVGCYLNSFYYATILYNLYKQMPNRILSLVSRVIKQEMNTMDLLNELNLYGDIRGEVFEKELGYIKKLIK